jgi:hypothetical protein
MSYLRLPDPVLDQPFGRSSTPAVNLRGLRLIVILALCVLAAPLAAETFSDACQAICG